MWLWYMYVHLTQTHHLQRLRCCHQRLDFRMQLRSIASRDAWRFCLGYSNYPLCMLTDANVSVPILFAYTSHTHDLTCTRSLDVGSDELLVSWDLEFAPSTTNCNCYIRNIIQPVVPFLRNRIFQVNNTCPYRTLKFLKQPNIPHKFLRHTCGTLTAYVYVMSHRLRSADSTDSNSTEKFDFLNDC